MIASEPGWVRDGVDRPRAPASRTLLGSLAFTGRLIGLGIGTGFVVGLVLLAAMEITSNEPVSGFAALLGVVVVGGCSLVGAFAVPVLGLTVLRGMPLRHAILWPTIFGIGGGLIDATAGGPAIIGAIGGLIVGAVALRLVVRSGYSLPGWRSFVGACVALWVGGRIATYAGDRRIVRSMLHISSLPRSVGVVGCESPGFSTDVLTKCVVTFTPGDLPRLLSGFPFTESPRPGTTAGMAYATPPSRTVLGAPFATATLYSVELKEKYGGQLRVFVNPLKTRALLDLYIE